MDQHIHWSSILQEIKKDLGSNSRVARKLKVTEKSVGTWLRKNEDELQRLQQDNKQAILALARELGIQTELFGEPASIWDLSKSYETNLQIPVSRPPEIVDPFREFNTPFLGYRLRHLEPLHPSLQAVLIVFAFLLKPESM